MSIRIADKALLAELAKAEGSVTIINDDGDVVGVFTPSKPAKHKLEPTVSEEELQKRERRTEGRTLAEIMADLEKRA